MDTLCIIPCGKKKIWDINASLGPMTSKEAYIGPFHKKCKEYAQMFYPNSWVILSAKYGFLYPDDTILGQYNVTFNDKKTNPINVKELILQASEKGLNQFDNIVVLGGKAYVKMITQVFSDKKITNPLFGCTGLGYMMQKLNSAIVAGKAIRDGDTIGFS